MRHTIRSITMGAMLFTSVTAVPNALAASQLVYIALDQPCRLLDTRTSQSGPGPLTAANGNYTFGSSDTDIESPAQNGNSAGCGIPAGIAAVSVSINQLNTTAAGNIRAWSSDAGTAGPGAGTAVYNLTNSPPSAGQVLYNGAYATVPVGADGRFHLAVSNGQLDVTMNIAGYWQPVTRTPADPAPYIAPGIVTFGTNNVASGPESMAIGFESTASGEFATAIGFKNQASGAASLATGLRTVASGTHSMANGFLTTASGDSSFSSGSETSATGDWSIAMGFFTKASAPGSVAIGFSSNATASDAVALGFAVNASGVNSIAMGMQSQSSDNSFVFGDGAAPTASGINQFVARATGGVKFLTSTGNDVGAQLASGSGTWTALSDRNAKTAVQQISGRDVLDRVVAMPLATWQYKTQDAKYRHMGPMAQDFYAAFGLGESDTGIDTIDADGVALAAIQGLNAKVEERDRELAALQAANAEKTRDVAELRAQIAELAAAIRQPAGAASP